MMCRDTPCQRTFCSVERLQFQAPSSDMILQVSKYIVNHKAWVYVIIINHIMSGKEVEVESKHLIY